VLRVLEGLDIAILKSIAIDKNLSQPIGIAHRPFEFANGGVGVILDGNQNCVELARGKAGCIDAASDTDATRAVLTGEEGRTDGEAD